MENSDILKEKIRALIEPVIKDNFMDLVEIEVSAGQSVYIRVFIDKIKGGVTLDDCAAISRQVEDVIDAAGDVIESRYYIEVSSPGIDRPLRKKEDFKRFIGQKAAFNLKKPIEGNYKVTGTIKAVTDEAVTVTENEKDTVIPFDSIKKARLEVDIPTDKEKR